ncbi:MAG TPA: exodeoxyribonuclease I [Stenotrophobium sp.]|jgi:exodeoxyribonuclease-1|nr:exodeoxyribonuclease I [Stenotrophobium sp.]
MSIPGSFLWHDYETFGADPARDRPAQFAGRRTTADLEPVGEPLVIYCRPAIDVLPHPDACLITGITPQTAQREGIAEPEFARRINEAFSVSGTCGVGYNSIRFDDEVTRNLLYRNFYEPYAREWFGGNSRWDLIDVMRLWHALRPDGLEWPQREDGATSFKLQHLSAANGIAHAHAHEALSDVDATIGLARRLRAAQPRLFEHALKLRDKKFAATQFNLREMAPLLHVSSKIPASRGCIAVIAPLAMHPRNGNQIIVYDLSHDPAEWLELDADELHDRVFTAEADLPEGLSRVPLKGVHLNKSPMLAPLSTLNPQQAERWNIDLARCRQNLAQLLRVRESLSEKVRAVFDAPEYDERDAELSLYAGFLPDADKPRLQRVREAAPETLAQFEGLFSDARYNELLFRYRARHYPHTLNEEERQRWQEFVARKLDFDTGLAGLTLEQYEDVLTARRAQEPDPARRAILDALQAWPRESGLLELLGL